jgi:hypothetical protein
MKHDPEIDEFICKHCGIESPLSYDKLKEAASIRGLKLRHHMGVRGPQYVMDHPDPTIFYKTRIAAYREGLIRWILSSLNGSANVGKPIHET